MLWILFSFLAIYIESSLYSPRLMYQTGFLLLFAEKDVSAVRTKNLKPLFVQTTAFINFLQFMTIENKLKLKFYFDVNA